MSSTSAHSMASEKPAFHSTSTSSNASQDDINDVGTESTWRPGYTKQMPVFGIAALLVMAILSIAAFGILCGSNNVSTDRWPQWIAPNVILSILNALSSLALAIAVGQGVAIAWWRYALRGSTVAELHKQWSFTTGAFKIVTHPKAVFTSSIALAVLATQVTLLNSILYQRATSTFIGTSVSSTTSSIGIGAQEFPMTGYVVSNTTLGAQAQCNCFMIGDTYTPVVTTWENSNGFFAGYNELFRVPASSNSEKYEYCNGACYTSLEAIGFEIDCDQSQNHTDIAIPALNAFSSNGPTSAYTNLPIFNSSFTLQYASPSLGINHSSIILSLQYFQSDNPYNPSSASCPGTVTQTTCNLRPALITYPVKVTNFTNVHIVNGVTLATQSSSSLNPSTLNSQAQPPPYSPSLKQAQGYQVNSYLYPADSHTIRSLTALGGLASALELYLSSSATITYEGNEAWSLSQVGTLSQTMMYGPPNMGSCDCSFLSSSLDTIIQGINELTFLTATGLVDTSSFRGLPSRDGKQAFPNQGADLPSAVVAATDSNSTAQFQVSSSGATQISDTVFYKTHYVFAGLALGVTLVCILLVLPSFWQYGQLGRRVTLGPMEIASAFEAPILVGNGEAAGTRAEGVVSGSKGRSKNVDHGIDGLIREIGDRKIQYGFIEVPDVHRDGVRHDDGVYNTGAGGMTRIIEEKEISGSENENGNGNHMVRAETFENAGTPPMSPALSEYGPAGTSGIAHKRKSVRLAIGAPHAIRPVSTVFEPGKSPVKSPIRKF